MRSGSSGSIALCTSESSCSAANANVNAKVLTEHVPDLLFLPSRSITTSYYRNSVGGLLVFDLTNRKTFEHVREWHKEVSEHILPHHMVYILIGHKSDLSKEQIGRAHV